MAPFNGVPTERQQKALALAPKFAAALSIFGSSYIIYDCISKRNKRITTSYHRLMVGLSVTDLLMSLGLFTTTWPMPRDTPNVFGAIGNTASCEAIGSIEQFGVSATIYNGCLSVYYLLRIRYGWTTKRLQRAEIWMHVIPLAFGISTIAASLALNLFNSGLFDCWIATFPQGCSESFRNDGFSDCERGDNATLYQWVFDVIPKWSSVLLTTINMLVLIYTVRSQELSTLQRIASRTQVDASDHDRIKIKPRVAIRLARQSYLYVGALYLTYIPVIVTRAFEFVNGYVHYEMLLTIAIMLPLQGFWNLIVYLRPQYIRLVNKRKQRREHQNGSSVHHERSRNTSFLNFVSEVVINGGLDDEEEDFTEETGENESQHKDNMSTGKQNAPETAEGESNSKHEEETFGASSELYTKEAAEERLGPASPAAKTA